MPRPMIERKTELPTVPCLVCKQGMIQVSPIQVHPTCLINPDVFATEILSLVRDHILNQPRSLQRMIGPSEIGHSCDLRIAKKLLQHDEVNFRGVAWKPFVGTCLHSEMEVVMTNAEQARIDEWEAAALAEMEAENRATEFYQRWHIEEKVNGGFVNEVGDIEGSCDLYDAATGIVWDWKFTSVNQIKKNYRPKGPGSQYFVQAHTYGRGWVDKGYTVTNVGILFMTRDGEFNDRYVWSGPYDQSVNEAALHRLAGLQSSLTLLGPEKALPTFRTADAYCQNCPFFKPRERDRMVGCPGHQTSEPARVDVFADILGSEAAGDNFSGILG